MSLFSQKETIEFDVKGMHCEKCVARVTEALENSEGVTSAHVSLENESATAEGHGMDSKALIAAIEAAGFTASQK